MPKGIYERTKEARENISKATKKMWENPMYREKTNKHKYENKNMLGKKHSKETIEKMKKSHTGKKQSEETIEKRVSKTRGKKRSIEVCRKISERVSEDIRTGKLKVYAPYAGIRKDLGSHYFKSRFEANYACLLNYLDISWEYEPKTFVLKDGRRYTPDFYLIEYNIFVELKGFETEEFKEKFTLVKKENPNVLFLLMLQKSKKWKKTEKIFKYKIKRWEVY